jgi:catechol 2,3-dioxygenase-like lactoylglutathione lyase family enzyme
MIDLKIRMVLLFSENVGCPGSDLYSSILRYYSEYVRIAYIIDFTRRYGYHPQRKELNMFKRVGHVEIVPSHVEKTIDFYVNVLTFRIKGRYKVKAPPIKEVTYIELGDTVIEIISLDNPKPKSENPWEVGYRGIALEVEDMSKAVDYLKQRGIPIVREPVDLGDSLRGEIRVWATMERGPKVTRMVPCK